MLWGDSGEFAGGLASLSQLAEERPEETDSKSTERIYIYIYIYIYLYLYMYEKYIYIYIYIFGRLELKKTASQQVLQRHRGG